MSKSIQEVEGAYLASHLVLELPDEPAHVQVWRSGGALKIHVHCKEEVDGNTLALSALKVMAAHHEQALDRIAILREVADKLEKRGQEMYAMRMTTEGTIYTEAADEIRKVTDPKDESKIPTEPSAPSGPEIIQTSCMVCDAEINFVEGQPRPKYCSTECAEAFGELNP